MPSSGTVLHEYAVLHIMHMLSDHLRLDLPFLGNISECDGRSFSDGIKVFEVSKIIVKSRMTDNLGVFNWLY